MLQMAAQYIRMMVSMDKDILLGEIKNATQKAVDWYTAIPADAFFTRHGETWSASDNVDHLIRAMTPLTYAVRFPKFSLRLMFGKVERPLRTYDEMCKIYEDAIRKGAVASGRFLPDQQMPADSEKAKAALIHQLSRLGNDIADALNKNWPDSALDACLLPHPILGKLTVREMMFFTIYHALRHARVEGD
jgi:hypothetical protein